MREAGSRLRARVVGCLARREDNPMDGSRFDDFARRVAEPGSRRGFLRTLAGLALGGAAAARAAAVEAARPGGLGAGCTTDRDCRTRFCGPGGTCACPPGREACN